MIQDYPIKKALHRVLAITHLNASTFIIRMERKGMTYRAGQHIGVGPSNLDYTREYSIYSGEADNDLEIIVREVENGYISPRLKHVKAGDLLQVEEPRGYFGLPHQRSADDHFLFVATGTGISPFHSFIKSDTTLNYTLLHGIGTMNDACEPGFYKKENLILCTSREKSRNAFNGRVTLCLNTVTLNNIARAYLCGNVNMINEVYDLLEKRKFPMEKIHSEVYF